MNQRVLEAELLALDSEARDKRLKDLWIEFGEIYMDPVTELMEDAFLFFPAGTAREDVWHWFDKWYSKGVFLLLYGIDDQ